MAPSDAGGVQSSVTIVLHWGDVEGKRYKSNSRVNLSGTAWLGPIIGTERTSKLAQKFAANLRGQFLARFRYGIFWGHLMKMKVQFY